MKDKPYQKFMTTHSKQKGFTLLELTLVIIAIGVLISAVSVGSNLHRSASNQKFATSFVLAWELAYMTHFTSTGVVIGDSTTTPTTKVNQGSGAALCDSTLTNAMLAAGVDVPSGRAAGYETHYSYLDSNGNPQDSSVCFNNMNWAVDKPPLISSAIRSYEVQKKNVMILSGLTPDIAKMLDTMIDGNADRRNGSFRDVVYLDSTTVGTYNNSIYNWSQDNTWEYGASAAPANPKDEAQVVVVNAYWLMNP